MWGLPEWDGQELVWGGAVPVALLSKGALVRQLRLKWVQAKGCLGVAPGVKAMQAWNVLRFSEPVSLR